LEVADWVTRQGGNAQRTRDFEIYPTGHVRYTVAQDWIIGGSFTRRVDRLRANDLDETVKYSGPLSYFSGRRDLKPEKTSAYELELEHEASGRNYLATGYYRSTSNRIGTLSTLRPDGAILDRRANIGEFRTAGLELVASGSVGSTITYKLTGRLAWNEVSGAEGAGSYRRSAWTPSSQANVNWKITDHDFVQINAVQLGEDLSQQRRREAFSVVNLGYRRKLADSLFLTATVSDLFDSAPRRERVRGETFDQDIDRRYDARRFTLSLSYAFGRRTGSLEDRFDYGN
jgi:outer membrane receptor for ferrienterochelin and colicin